MRVVIVYFSNHKNKRLEKLASSLSEGIASQGHQVDILNGDVDTNSKLTVYNYIAVGVEGINLLGGKISSQASTFLSNSGLVRGKRSYAFTIKGGLRPQKTLSKLMKVMEHEGLYLKKSDILSKPEEALNVGKRLHIY